MSDVHPRHRYGTYALILALLAVVFAGFSKGAVWATVDEESTTIISNDFFGNMIVNVSMTSDLHLREMETETVSTLEFEDESFGTMEPVEFSEIKTYDELAQNSAGNVSSTFEDLDNAGAVAGWMIWIGIVSVYFSGQIFPFLAIRKREEGNDKKVPNNSRRSARCPRLFQERQYSARKQKL